MEILFGPAHDARHLDPDTPNGYEWWYFDALSDEGHVLVVIFFLGTPMSPYYKAVVDGKNPLPRDWCGVFVSLHSKEQGKKLRERAYAYNLYRNGDFSEGNFFTNGLTVSIGDSRLRGEFTDGVWRWHLTLKEPGLWRGVTEADLTFTLFGTPPTAPTIAEQSARPSPSDHHWVCVAPRCRVEGTVTGPGVDTVPFVGTGYHDHNFGALPWRDTRFWFWTRFHLDAEQPLQTVVLYRTVPLNGKENARSFVLLFDKFGQLIADPLGMLTPLLAMRNAYGFEHENRWNLMAANGQAGTVELTPDVGLLSEGPFYRRIRSRLTMEKSGAMPASIAEGIGEVFQPARLCGPIASRAMWTRMRRRS